MRFYGAMRIYWIKGFWLVFHPFLWGHPRRAYVVLPWICFSRIEPAKMSREHLDHEYAHCRQIAREGPLFYWIKYLYLWVRNGRENHEWEAEARQYSADKKAERAAADQAERETDRAP